MSDCMWLARRGHTCHSESAPNICSQALGGLGSIWQQAPPGGATISSYDGKRRVRGGGGGGGGGTPATPNGYATDAKAPGRAQTLGSALDKCLKSVIRWAAQLCEALADVQSSPSDATTYQRRTLNNNLVDGFPPYLIHSDNERAQIGSGWQRWAKTEIMASHKNVSCPGREIDFNTWKCETRLSRPEDAFVWVQFAFFQVLAMSDKEHSTEK